MAAASCGSSSRPDLSRGGTIHVAAIQLTPVSGDLGANQQNVERLVREAAARGARYIVLPEYYPGQLTNRPGMSLEAVRAQAEPLDGPIARHILRLCRELGVYVAFPLAERRADGVYNSLVFAGPDGIEGVQSKAALINVTRGRILPATATARPRVWQEDEIYRLGGGTGIVTWGGVRAGALICADGGFPALYEQRIAAGAQLIVHASASAGVKTGPRNPMPDVAAARYHRPVVFANQRPNALPARGNSQICDAEGGVRAHAGARPNAVVDAVIEIPPLAG